MGLKPLFKLLEMKPYPEHQYMDKLSLTWLYENTKPIPVQPNSIINNYKKYPFKERVFDLRPFMNKQQYSSIHGVGHSVRVSVYCWFIIQSLDLEKSFSGKEINELLQAGLIHDIGRVNDNTDLEHGKRAELWARKKLPGELSGAMLFAIAEHSKPPSNLANTDQKSQIALDVLKSADALDRYRLPKEKWWPNKELIPYDVSHLLELCKYITLATEQELLNLSEPSKTQSLIKYMESIGI